jgi:hypothetical protein
VVRSRPFRALAYEFSLTIEGDDSLGPYAESLFAALPIGAGDVVEWLVRPVADADTVVEGGPVWELVIDGNRHAAVATLARLVPQLVQTLNAFAVPSWHGVACHAGGVARGDAAIVLPANMEWGKTTLTAGLVRAGFSYLTDEAVAFVPGTTTIEPFPKPLSIDRGSWFLFPELEPDAPLASDDYKLDQWQVVPAAFRSDAVGGPASARILVFPRYVEGADTALTPIGRAEALVELAKNTFAFNQKARPALDELAGIVRQVACYRLTVGALDDAVAIVERLADELPALDGVGA